MQAEEFAIPQEWELSRIGDAYRFTKKPRGLDPARNGETVPFFAMADIPIGRIYVSDYQERPVAKLGSGTYIEKGDVVVAKITPSFENGKQGIVDIDTDYAFATTEVIPLSHIPGRSDPLFLFFFLLHPEIRATLAGKMEGSTGRQRLSKAVLADCVIPLPPLPEQQQIAAVLSKVYQSIELQRQLVEATVELKKAVMHGLFTRADATRDQASIEDFPVPEGWELRELHETVESIEYGLSKAIPKTPPANGVKIVSTADITRDGEMLYGQIRRIDAPERTLRRLVLKAGDVLFNWRNSPELVGKTAVFQGQDELHIFASFILRIRCDEEQSHNYYFAHLLNYLRYRGVFMKLARRAVNQANYNKNEIAKLKIPMPSDYSEQVTVASRINVLDRKISYHKGKQQIFSDLFNTLVHLLMGGEMRVRDLDVSPLLTSRIGATGGDSHVEAE